MISTHPTGRLNNVLRLSRLLQEFDSLIEHVRFYRSRIENLRSLALFNSRRKSWLWLMIIWVYHSSFVDEEEFAQKSCGCPLLPLKSHDKRSCSSSFRTSELDEQSHFSGANVFFRNLIIRVPSDKLLIFDIYINVGFEEAEGMPRTLAEGTKQSFSILRSGEWKKKRAAVSVAYKPMGLPNKWWIAFAKRKFMIVYCSLQ
ncbi:LOW QUALITY PROTEIN: actin-related protein 2/3 complex subunit 3 [Jatropha curcas]|uniref:LOW QUALITY PROTEIN: actin-related protein 2/3 complex subunit 3 n=1 Tax=Jatropha curcas TaxID=180498 RepID=UPI00189623AB|nr:LOW QUALITY PROTEIN: actin-related protein 2/3 complex subunit 3 [Jatropha curcas]